MKLLEKIKAIPKRTLAIACVLILLIVSTVVLCVAVASREDEVQEPTDNKKQPVVFFDDTDDSGNTDSTPTVDLSGVGGLSYVSRGDGTCYVSGLGSCTLTEIEIPSKSPSGDKVTKIGDGAFQNCDTLVAVTIPDTVKVIGTGAFRGCEKLVAINVSAENSVYCSVGGVLFSKDKSVLVCYPMNRQGASYLLNTSVKAVAAFAFEGVENLDKLLYEGSIAKFQDIDILMGNDILDKMAITCNYVPTK